MVVESSFSRKISPPTSPLGEVHRLSNPGSTLLEIIVAQSGGCLGEYDIMRLEDRYGRGP
ncbi:hypothetical protein [Dechloromonas denitrificans]|uniref:hypothetical protein n=1 Tax=Dechloromonas denitrificans TaxID=281362 RepID=UPI0039B07C4F